MPARPDPGPGGRQSLVVLGLPLAGPAGCWHPRTHGICLRLRPGGRRGGLQARHGGKVRTYVRRSAELCKHAAANGNHVGREMQRPCMSAAGWVPAAPARRRSQCVSLRHHGLMAPLPVSVNPLSRWAVRV